MSARAHLVVGHPSAVLLDLDIDINAKLVSIAGLRRPRDGDIRLVAVFDVRKGRLERASRVLASLRERKGEGEGGEQRENGKGTHAGIRERE